MSAVRHNLPHMTTQVMYYGGKSYLAGRIIAAMPPHRRYIEPFFGGGSVFLRKPAAQHEVINDLDHEVMTFWRVVRESPDLLHDLLWATPYSRAEFVAALERDPDASQLEQARRFFIRQNQGFNGMANSPGDWSTGTLITRQHAEVVSKWQTKLSLLRTTAERLREAILECDDVERLLPRYIEPATAHETLIYADPPYLHATRSGTTDYAHEMDTDGHVRLLTALTATPAMVLLSGYESELYHDLLPGWSCVHWDMAARSAGKVGNRRHASDPRRTECLWRNPAAMDALARQPALFDEEVR